MGRGILAFEKAYGASSIPISGASSLYSPTTSSPSSTSPPISGATTTTTPSSSNPSSSPSSTSPPISGASSTSPASKQRVKAPSSPVITSPSSGSTYNTNSITITGTADASSTAVDVFDTVNKVTTQLNSPNSIPLQCSVTTCTWSFQGTFQDGSHTLTAQATNTAGTSRASSPVSITVNTAPIPQIPQITYPTSGSTVSNSFTISGTAEAGSTVQVFANGKSLGTITASTNSWQLNVKLSQGTYSLTATATNTAGNTSPASLPVFITVVNQSVAPPAPVITSPTTGNYTTNSFTISGTADSAYAGSPVQVFDSGASLGTTTVSTAGVWQLPQQVILPDGTHELTATATNFMGTSPSSQVVTITVNTNAG
jgi:large repetitive protein